MNLPSVRFRWTSSIIIFIVISSIFLIFMPEEKPKDLVFTIGSAKVEPTVYIATSEDVAKTAVQDSIDRYRHGPYLYDMTDVIEIPMVQANYVKPEYIGDTTKTLTLTLRYLDDDPDVEYKNARVLEVEMYGIRFLAEDGRTYIWTGGFVVWEYNK